MLIGIEYSDLSRRSQWLLLASAALVATGAALYAWAPAPPERLLRVGMLSILVLGAYWLSFLVDFRGRLDRTQILLATALGLLPWLLVLVLAVFFPQWLLAILPAAG